MVSITHSRKEGGKKAIAWKLAREKGGKKSKALPTSSIQTGFKKKKKGKKSLGKEPAFKQHDLCRVPVSRSVLFLSCRNPEEPETEDHRFPLSQRAAAGGVAMVTTKLISLHFPTSAQPKGCAVSTAELKF